MPVAVKNRIVSFSHWPMQRGTRRFGLADEVFTTDPWSLIKATVRERCPAPALETAQSFVRQSQEYSRAATSAHAQEALPVLHYYSFLNLAKALILTNKVQTGLATVWHGLKEDPNAPTTILSALVTAQRTSSSKRVQAFDEFLKALGEPGIPTKAISLSVLDLFAHSVVGHRLWRKASGRKERLARITNIRLWEDKAAKEIWPTLEFDKAAVRAMSRTTKELVQLGGLVGSWRAVADPRPGVIVLEKQDSIKYGHRAADKIQELVDQLRWTFPRVFSSIPHYRAYYLYLAPSGAIRLPQPAATYAAMFWLGSITRYRPKLFLDAMNGPFGPFLSEFLAVQPTQMLYECACQFRNQEVTQAAVVT